MEALFDGRYGMPDITIEDKELGQTLHNSVGTFDLGAYRTVRSSDGHQAEHIVVYKNLARRPTLLRINSACLTGDIFGDRRCDCSWQLEKMLRLMQAESHGLLIYHLHHEGRANGSVAKLRSFGAEDRGLPGRLAYEVQGVSADSRRYQSSLLIIRDLGIS